VELLLVVVVVVIAGCESGNCITELPILSVNFHQLRISNWGVVTVRVNEGMA
jgi:hypothetical protein